MPHRDHQVTEVQAPGGAHVVVTLESIYTLVLQTSAGVTEANTKLDAATDAVRDHEDRIRNLEKRVYLWAGGIGALAGGLVGLLPGVTG